MPDVDFERLSRLPVLHGLSADEMTMALVAKQPNRTADVVALEATRLLGFDYAAYDRLVTGQPAIGRKLRGNLGRVAASRAWTMQTDESEALRRRSGKGT